MSEGWMPPRGDGQVCIGLDVGGTKVAAGLVDDSGHVLIRRRRPTRPGDLLCDLEAMCVELVAAAQARGLTVMGVGVGVKGAVDRHVGRLVHSIYLDQRNIPIADTLRQALDLPVWLENDVHAATIGEIAFGAGRNWRDFLLLNAGTGISVGIVAGGRLYRGSSGVAGENGHVSMDQSGAFPCPCGLSGCMETIILSSRTGTTIPGISELLSSDHEPSVAFGYVLEGLVDLLNLFAPQAIVLAGGMLGDPSTIAWLEQSARRLAPEACGHLRRVLAAHAGPDTGLVGSSALPFYRRHESHH